jgi:hypothetical protein
MLSSRICAAMESTIAAFPSWRTTLPPRLRDTPLRGALAAVSAVLHMPSPGPEHLGYRSWRPPGGWRRTPRASGPRAVPGAGYCDAGTTGCGCRTCTTITSRAAPPECLTPGERHVGVMESGVDPQAAG